jgi:endonuclease YncB( thermonuclease family)
MNSVIKLLTTLAVLICSSLVGAAATLQAKVVEVPTGNTLVVSNTNRSVRVRLKAVAPPEAGQAFSEAARDHLKALVLDQAVLVDYTHLVDGYLEARVFLNSIDIGSQMLRDGVAWYDHATDYELTESDRALYAQCEQAARADKRGLWHDESPLAPWEYRRIQQAKIDAIATGRTSSLRNPNPRPNQTSLSTADLMGDFTGGSPSSKVFPGLRPIVQNGSADKWTSFESPYSHFSVMIPGNGLEGSIVTRDANGQSVALDVVKVLGESAHLLVIAGRGPDTNLTESSFIDKSIHEFINSINQEKVQRGRSASEMLSLKPVRDLKLANHSGRQYDLKNEWFSGTARVFTKRLGSDRQLFILLTLTRPGGEGIAGQFLNSFKITE